MDLKLHEVEVGGGGGEALGIYLDGRRHVTRKTLKRFGMVRKAAYYLLTMSKVSGQIIEVFLGHCIYCSLVNRDLLVCFSAAYAFIQKHYYKPVSLWTSVREEIKAFGGVIDDFCAGELGLGLEPEGVYV